SMSSHDAGAIHRRLFLGSAGTLAVMGTPAFAKDAESETRAQPSPAAGTKLLSTTIGDFVSSFDASSLPPLAIDRARLAFIDTIAVMLAGSRQRRWEIGPGIGRQGGAAAAASRG